MVFLMTQRNIMEQKKIVAYIEYIIIAIILIVASLPLFDAVTSIFIILFLFTIAMALLYFRILLFRNEFFEF
jgi:hypothetical protein